jgi:hypothetical protein
MKYNDEYYVIKGRRYFLESCGSGIHDYFLGVESIAQEANTHDGFKQSTE